MYSEHEVLRLIRDRIDHPATVKELLQTLRVPREARATFRRRLQGLVGAARSSKFAATASVCPTA